MVPNNNNSNVIPTTDRQGVSNRDMVGITAPQQTFFRMDLNPEKPIHWESRNVHPLVKTLFLSKRRSITRKIETFCRILDKYNTGSQNFGHSKRKENSISFKTFSLKNPFPTNSELRRGRIGDTVLTHNLPDKDFPGVSHAFFYRYISKFLLLPSA